MLAIHTVWNGARHEAQLHAMQTYDDFVAQLAKEHNTHPSFMVLENVHNMQTLLERRESVAVYDALPYAYRRTEFAAPNFTKVASDETRVLLSHIFVVTHALRASTPDMYFRMMIPDGIVQNIDAVLADTPNITARLRRMLGVQVDRHAPVVDDVTLPYQATEVLHEQLTVKLGSRLHDNRAPRLLDVAQLDQHVPYVQCRDFFKCAPGFRPCDEWVNVAATKYPDNMLMIKYNPERPDLRPLANPYNSYYEAAVAYNGTEFQSTIDIPAEGQRHVGRDECIARAYACLGPHVYVEDHWQSDLIARIPLTLDAPAEMSTFVDFVMNDEYTRRTFAIDESSVPHRARPIIYMHLMGSRQVMSLSLMTEGRAVLKFRVTDLEVLMFLRDCFDIMWHRYSVGGYRDECIAFYRDHDQDPFEWGMPHGSDIQPQQARTTGRIASLREAEPDVFINTYSRYCSNMPRIVDVEEAQAIRRRHGSAYLMDWPLYGETTKRTYACTHNARNKFPGVHVNRLEANKDAFPYVPCCYTVDQYNKRGSGLTHYINQGAAAITDGVPEDTAAAVPPDTVRKLLGDDVAFGDMRGGLFAVTGIPLTQVKTVLLDDRVRPACYQEFSTVFADDMYIAQPAQFLQKVVGSSDIFDATLFYRIVEVINDTSVYILNRRGFVVPPNHKGHLKYAPEGERVTLLFDHGDKNYSVLRGATETAASIHAMFLDTCNVFAMGKRTVAIRKLPNVVRQRVDRFGKCRYLYFADGHEQYVKPCPPYPVYIAAPVAMAEHAIRAFDNEHRDARRMLNRLRHMYAMSGMDVDTFEAQHTSTSAVTMVRHGKFHSPHLGAFMAKLRVELANDTFVDPGAEPQTYEHPNDFSHGNVFSTHAFNSAQHDHSTIVVRDTLCDTTPETAPFMFMLDADSMCLVQNCGTSLSKAASVCAEWRAHRRNAPGSGASVQAQPDYIWTGGKLLQMDTRGVFQGQFATGVAVVTDIAGDQFLALLKV
ncbi:hypothetical protein [Infectious spleen and kidney necrosis virus]|nr:hypothetical protein [Infectious spleen and kidney necrosis virus]